MNGIELTVIVLDCRDAGLETHAHALSSYSRCLLLLLTSLKAR
jgi:hypothetical protein